MKLLPLFLVSLTTAAWATDCQDLGNIAQRFEKDLSQSFIQNGEKKCSEFTATHTSDEVKKIFDEYKCKSLGFVESEIALMEAQEAAFLGFQKLRLDLQVQQDKTKSANHSEAKKAAAEFAEGLNKAKTFEAVGIIPEEKRKKFLDELRKLSDDKIKDSVKLKVEMARVCKKLQIPEKVENKSTACDVKAFKPGEKATKELVHFAELNKHPEAKAEVKGLEIEKPDGTPYSFTQMSADLIKELDKVQGKPELPLIVQGLKKLSKTEIGIITKEEIKAIASLPQIEIASDSYKTIMNNDRFRKDMNAEVSEKRQKFLFSDLRYRQNLEIQNRMTHLVSLYPNFFPGEAKEICGNAKFGVTKIEECLNLLKKDMPDLVGADANDFADQLKNIESSWQFNKELFELNSSECARKDQNQSQMASGLKCDHPVLNVEELNKNYQKIEALQTIRTKIMEENANNYKLRNYALKAMKDKNCLSDDISKVDFCEVDTKINPEVSFLSSFASDVLFRYVKPKEEEKLDISELCANNPKKDTAYLCNLDKKPEAEEEEQITKNEDAYRPLVPTRSRQDSTFSDTAATLLNAVRSALTPPYMPTMPASGYANPNASGAPRMSISQELVMPAVAYGGLGVYQPPYTQLTPNSYASTMFR